MKLCEINSKVDAYGKIGLALKDTTESAVCSKKQNVCCTSDT